MASAAPAAGLQVSAGKVVGADLNDDPVAVELALVNDKWTIGISHLASQSWTDRQGTTGEVNEYWLVSGHYRVQADVGDFVLEFSPGLSLRSRGHNVGYLLPSTVNASLTFGLSRGPFVLEWRHHSNANTRDTNIGQDWLQIGYRFK